MMCALSCAQAQQSKPPVLMISVDGLRPDYVTQAASRHLHLPVLEGFMQQGTYADGVVGVVPTLTFVGHTTLVTGVWPDRHGINNNLRFDPLSHNNDAWYWYSSDIKAPTLWHAAAQAGIVTASLFWPATVNANDINYLIPAYPVRLREDSHLMEAISRPDGYLQKIEKQTGPFYIFGAGTDFDEQLTKTAIAMIKSSKPGFMTLHLVSLDHAEHLTGPFSPQSIASIEAIDEMIGELVKAERANDSNAIVVVASDHGFAATHTSVNLLIPFVQAGLIQLKPKAGNGSPSIASWKATLWNAGGSAYVMLHDSNDQTTREQVQALLERLKENPSYGISGILSHDEIVARGGDPEAAFLVDWKTGYTGGEALEGNIVREIPGTGTHGYLPDNPELRSAFFAMGGSVARHCDTGIIDMRQIAPTVAGYMGVSLPDVHQPAIHCVSKP
jgi:predicted AlkP superfamily pyrophosphatase or phosphodiesterase